MVILLVETLYKTNARSDLLNLILNLFIYEISVGEHE